MSDNNSTTYAANDEMEIDLRELLKVLKKWSRLIIAMTLLTAFSAGIISYFVLSPLYQANTLLMVTQATEKLQNIQNRQQDGLEGVVGNVSSIPVLTMQTYLGQLKSETLMQRIITALELDPEHYTPAGLAKAIQATAVKDSNLIEVKVTNGDPLLAAQIANVLSQEFLQLMTEKNQEQMSRSVDFLEKQKQITDEELQISTNNLMLFQSQPRGVAVLESEFNSKSQAAADFTNRLRTVQVEVQLLSRGIEQLEQEIAITPQTIYTQNYNQNTDTYMPREESNPLYLSLAQKLSEKRAQLAEKVGEAEALQTQSINMQMELDYLQAELAEKRLTEEKLTRKVELLKKTSTTLAEKATETQIAKSIDLGDTNVSVVSAASIPNNPIKPNKKLNVAIAAVLGLMIFTLLAFILEYLDNTLKTTEDVSRELQLPVLGVIPVATIQNSEQGTYGG